MKYTAQDGEIRFVGLNLLELSREADNLCLSVVK